MLTEALVVNGRLRFSDEFAVARDLAKKNGKRLRVRWDVVKPLRTAAQNRLTWVTYSKALRHFSQLSGFSKEELHAYLKKEFLPQIEGVRRKRVVGPGGVVIKRWSTTVLTIEQQSEYLTKCMAMFAKWGME